jgi:hypothetical protein
VSGDGAAELEREGIRAFNDLAAAVAGLHRRLDGLSHELADRVIEARNVAATTAQAARDAQGAASADARARIAAAVLAALAATLLAGGAGYLLGRAAGWEHGRADGYLAAADEKAAAAWANSADGRRAWAMDRNGSLAVLARCGNPGWKVERKGGRRVCYPHADEDGNVYGWRLP